MAGKKKKRRPGRPDKGDVLRPIIMETLEELGMAINANALSKLIHETRGVYFHEKTVRHHATKLWRQGRILRKSIYGHIYFAPISHSKKRKK